MDLLPLNKFCKREIHAFEALFHLALLAPIETHGKPGRMHGMGITASHYKIPIDTSPHSLHHLVNGNIQEHRKVSFRPETGIIVDSVRL